MCKGKLIELCYVRRDHMLDYGQVLLAFLLKWVVKSFSFYAEILLLLNMFTIFIWRTNTSIVFQFKNTFKQQLISSASGFFSLLELVSFISVILDVVDWIPSLFSHVWVLKDQHVTTDSHYPVDLAWRRSMKSSGWPQNPQQTDICIHNLQKHSLCKMLSTGNDLLLAPNPDSCKHSQQGRTFQVPISTQGNDITAISSIFWFDSRCFGHSGRVVILPSIFKWIYSFWIEFFSFITGSRTCFLTSWTKWVKKKWGKEADWMSANPLLHLPFFLFYPVLMCSVMCVVCHRNGIDILIIIAPILNNLFPMLNLLLVVDM